MFKHSSSISGEFSHCQASLISTNTTQIKPLGIGYYILKDGIQPHKVNPGNPHKGAVKIKLPRLICL